MVVDVHCHLLPGIDDGPQTLDDALNLARHAAASGISRSILTPHILPNRYDNTLEGIRKAAAKFRNALAANKIALEIGYAAEVRVGPEIVQLAEEHVLPFLGTVDGYGIVLIEFPDSHILPGSDKLAAWLLGRKIRPLIAHPERNKDILRDGRKLLPFVREGCLVQLTADAVAGEFGEPCALRAREFLERGWVTVLASDAHDTVYRPPRIAPGRDAAARIVGETEALRLTRDNPRRIVRAEEPR